MSGRSSVDDPLKAYSFVVEIEGFVRAGFSEATGLEMDVEVVEYREGGDNATAQKSPGLASFANVILKRGQLVSNTSGGDDDMENWAREVHETNVYAVPLEFRRTVDIVQFHRNGSEAVRWRLFEAWLKRSKPISDLNGTANENSLEEIEVVHEGYVRVKGSGIGAAVSAAVGSFSVAVGI